MSISESQLQTWSSAPGATLYQNSHTQVRNALSADDELKKRGYEVYLQGSYKNSTNIRGDSDVDVVVQLNDVYYHDISELPLEQQQLFNSSRTPATYSLNAFKQSVIVALQRYFGSQNVTIGNKSIKLAKNQGRLETDIVVACEYRYFTEYTNYSQRHIAGITFFTQDSRQIINYPKVHYDNGASKNQAANEMFKPLVRIFKNINKQLVGQTVLTDNSAPSYYIECLVYNVPNERFTKDTYSQRMYEILTFLQSSDPANFETVSGRHWLCRGSQWNADAAKAFIYAVINLWNS